MADQRKGGISWTDRTWNPIRGCSRVSQGCVNCYAESMAARFSGPGQPYEGLAKMTPSGARWTGKVEMVEKHLGDPLKWRKPAKIFVNSMSDLFHESLSNDQIRAVFMIMAKAHWHTFQVLTKRPERMLQFLEAHKTVTWKEGVTGRLPRNIWLGVSIENQATADERIPILLQCPSAIRFVSYEPALGPVVLRPEWMRQQRGCDGKHYGRCGNGLHHHHDEFCGPRLDWIIVGGESGPGARPFNIRWAMGTKLSCQKAGVAFFMKQIGSACGAKDRAGKDMSEWPEELRVQQFPVSESERAVKA